MYICTKCQKEKTSIEMSKDASRRHGIASWCKDCRAISARTWGKSNPEKVREQRRMKPVNPTQSRNYILKHRYGLSVDSYNKMLETQEYGCAICKRDSREMTYYLHVDHCHATGKVRGLLCSPCNTYLGYIKDNPQIFTYGRQYLE